VPPAVHIVSLRQPGAIAQLRELLEGDGLAFPAPSEHIAHAEAWIPWYPVLDRQVCVDCGKCFDFCLFGVYSQDDGVVTVRNPRNCKNNCPACARVCPVNAVIFPKFGRAPINGGMGSATPANSDAGKPEEAQLVAERKARRRRLFNAKFEDELGE